MVLRLIFAFSLVFMAFDQPKLVKTKITAGITVSIPKDWKPMDNMDFSERYPSVRAPIAAFTNEERSVDFSVNISATQWPDADLIIAKSFFKSSIQNMFDKVQFVNEGIREVNGKKFIFFEFESRVNGVKNGESLREPILRYSHLQYLVEPTRTLVFSFNCPKRLREDWQSVADAMQKSVKIK
jgi:hypothetical protein